MATIDTNDFPQGSVEYQAIDAALQNVSVLVQQAKTALHNALTSSYSPVAYIPNVSRTPPLACDRDCIRLFWIFRINVRQSTAASDIDIVERRYNAATAILNESGMRIARLTPAILSSINRQLRRLHEPEIRAQYCWGYAYLPAGMSSMVIYIGEGFFSPQADDRIRRRVVNCQSSSGRVNLLTARTAVLVHEALHWHNGQGGHDPLRPLENPVNYGNFIMDTNCDRLLIAQTEVASERRLAMVEEESPGVAPSDGRLRKPGPSV